MKESEIQSEIINYLQILENQGKLFFHRMNNIPPVNKVNGVIKFRRLPTGAKRGVPDIIVIKNGKFIGIEVKTKTGTQSTYQKEVEKNIKKQGAEYYVVRSLADVQSILK